MTARRLGAEFIGTTLLLLAIVGSGVSASTDGPASAQLFQHATVVGAALATLIVTFGSVSGAHFNPAVSIVDSMFGGLDGRTAAGYVAAQVGGAVTGVVLANSLFGLPPVAIGTTDRIGAALVASEVVATYGLLVVIFGVIRSGRNAAVPAAVGSWIAAAIYFTSSASFANPAVTIARQLTDSYTGIAPAAVPGFIGAQLVGAAAAWLTIRWLFQPAPEMAGDVVVPRRDPADTGACR
ncbi:MAG: aquaporin [Euzebyaceae bacterium]|jgi:arsenate reductase|nr:aquaporin [Euzebyaceae bacterium]